MMKIEPRVSVGPLKFGMSESEFTGLLDGDYRSFRRTPISTNDILAFDQAMAHVTVDDDRRIKEISLFRPREVFLGDVQLLNRPLEDIAEALNQAGSDFKAVDVGLESKSLGIVLVEVDGVIDGVELRQ